MTDLILKINNDSEAEKFCYSGPVADKEQSIDAFIKKVEETAKALGCTAKLEQRVLEIKSKPNDYTAMLLYRENGTFYIDIREEALARSILVSSGAWVLRPGIDEMTIELKP